MSEVGRERSALEKWCSPHQPGTISYQGGISVWFFGADNDGAVNRLASPIVACATDRFWR